MNEMPPVTHAQVFAVQGGIISGYYRKSCDGKPCSFTITFGNPGTDGVKYCEAYNDRYNKCKPDDNQFKGQNPDVRPPPPSPRKRGEPPVKRTGGIYETESGMQISSGDDLEPGTILMRALLLAPRNSTMTNPDLDEEDGDEWDSSDTDPVDLVPEVIKRKVR